jgi:replication initiator protein A
MAAALLLGYQVPWRPSRPKIHERAQARLIVCVIQAAIVYPWGVTAKALTPARKPIERRIYELVRKHCGDSQESRIGLPKLHLKIGTTAPLFKFRAAL